MKTLLVIAVLVVLPWAVFAQEIYKWEDEKGVVHYGDTPNRPAAKPLEKDTVPYSTTGDLPPESPVQKKARIRSEREEEHADTPRPELVPFPGLIQPTVQLDRNRRLHLSGAIYNAGPGMCESPSVEVVIFDELGSADGEFETAAFPNEIAGREEAYFEGEYLTPVGDFLSWDAIPRCDSSAGVVYGAHKRGTVSLRR